jgi:hypothetical protein
MPNSERRATVAVIAVGAIAAAVAIGLEAWWWAGGIFVAFVAISVFLEMRKP